MKIIMNCIYQKNFGHNKDYRNASRLFVAILCIIKHSDKDQLSHIFLHWRHKFFICFLVYFKSTFCLLSKNAFLKFIMKIDTTIHNTKVTKYLWCKTSLSRKLHKTQSMTTKTRCIYIFYYKILLETFYFTSK